MSDYEPILKYMKISDIDLSNSIKSVLRIQLRQAVIKTDM